MMWARPVWLSTIPVGGVLLNPVGLTQPRGESCVKVTFSFQHKSNLVHPSGQEKRHCFLNISSSGAAQPLLQRPRPPSPEVGTFSEGDKPCKRGEGHGTSPTLQEFPSFKNFVFCYFCVDSNVPYRM